jgi:hypothetical protein
MIRNAFAVAMSVALFAGCGGSRSSECEIADCDQTLVDACITSVEACEEVGGSTEEACVDAIVTATEASCEVVPAE